MIVRVLLFVLPLLSDLGVHVTGSTDTHDFCSDIFEGSCLEGSKFAEEYRKAQTQCKCNAENNEEENVNLLQEKSSVERTREEDCRTNNGVLCAFPFRYKGKRYKKCTDEDLGGVFWCKTGDGLWDYGACNTTMHSCMESYGGGCATIEPTAQCYFPFKYKGKLYNGCTRIDFGGNRWCGTAPDVDIIHWAECDPECPDDNSQSEYCIYKELGWVDNDTVSASKVRSSIDLLFENNSKVKEIVMMAFELCFLQNAHVPSIHNHLNSIENMDKLSCLKLVSNFLCDDYNY
uniref:Epididymal spermbinding protein 1like [Chrysemys picta] n=1 Tax=Lepeophtheirus salmonis TaxID=72036 RepID=A0A0K2TH90_LEPSM